MLTLIYCAVLLAAPADLTNLLNVSEAGCHCLRFNPMQADAVAFVHEVLGVVEEQRSLSSNGPCVYSLASVGPENVSVLLESLSSPLSSRQKNVVIWALAVVIEEKHIELIRNLLAEQPQLFEIIEAKGWERFFRREILESLNKAPELWGASAARLCVDDEVTEALGRAFLASQLPLMTYLEFKNNPMLVWKELTAEKFKRVQQGSADKRIQVESALLAAFYGDALALKFLASICMVDEYWTRTIKHEHLFALLSSEKPVASCEDFQSWIAANEANMAFDSESHQFSSVKHH